MTDPETLWGIHVADMPNFYMMIGPQSLNPVTNVTLLCEEQSKYIASIVSEMKKDGYCEVEPKQEAVARWSNKCNETAEERFGCSATIGIRKARRRMKRLVDSGLD